MDGHPKEREHAESGAVRARYAVLKSVGSGCSEDRSGVNNEGNVRSRS